LDEPLAEEKKDVSRKAQHAKFAKEDEELRLSSRAEKPWL
jgi:hypothetical protein